jgi:hypothetical protein
VRHLSASGTGLYVAVQAFGALIGAYLADPQQRFDSCGPYRDGEVTMLKSSPNFTRCVELLSDEVWCECLLTAE